MASFVVFSLLAMCFFAKQATAYYCDSDQCSVDEYCCGQNICCTNYAVWQMWYFWCGMGFFMVMLTACAGFCKYRYYHTAIIIHGGNPYSRLEEDGNAVYKPVIMPQQYTNQLPQDPPKYAVNYPPPAYSAQEKDPNYKR